MTDTTPQRPALEVSCPSCGETTVYASTNPFRPFCSARCQGQDFGAWANEAYRVEAPPTTADQDDTSH